VPETQKKNGGHHKRVENYPGFDNLGNVIQHGLEGFIVKHIEGESRRQTILVLFCSR